VDPVRDAAAGEPDVGHLAARLGRLQPPQQLAGDGDRDPGRVLVDLDVRLVHQRVSIASSRWAVAA
jgi:hypothetical protein